MGIGIGSDVDGAAVGQQRPGERGAGVVECRRIGLDLDTLGDFGIGTGNKGALRVGFGGDGNRAVIGDRGGRGRVRASSYCLL